MPLNLTVGDGDFTPYLKYNAKAGRFYVKPEGATEDVEIINPTLAIDMAHIRTGWIYYAEGAGPEKVWDPSPQAEAPRPPGPKKFKRGFEVMVFNNAPVPGTNKPLGLREFSSTAGNVIAAIVQMHADYEAGMTEHPNQVPVYQCHGVRPISGVYGTNYEPIFKIKMWVDRAKIPACDEAANRPAPPAKPSGNGAPPPAATYPRTRETVTAGGGGSLEDFVASQPPMDDEPPF